MFEGLYLETGDYKTILKISWIRLSVTRIKIQILSWWIKFWSGYYLLEIENYEARSGEKMARVNWLRFIWNLKRNDKFNLS